jgi:hypothetical protein
MPLFDLEALRCGLQARVNQLIAYSNFEQIWAFSNLGSTTH